MNNCYIIYLDRLSIRRLAKYLDITGYIGLYKSCKHMYYCLNDKNLITKIINNSVIIDTINTVIECRKFTQANSYVLYDGRKILHGINRLIDETGRDIVYMVYNRNILQQSIVKDIAGRYTTIYTNDLGAIKIKYRRCDMFVIYNGIYWDMNIDTGELIPFKYTYKTPYNKFTTFYYNNGYTHIYSRFDIYKLISIPNYLKKLMGREQVLRPVISDIITKYNVFANIHNNTTSNMIIFDKFGNVKYTDGADITKYKNGKVIKKEFHIYPFTTQINDYKHNIKKTIVKYDITAELWSYGNCSKERQYTEGRNADVYTYTINGVKYTHRDNGSDNDIYSKTENNTDIIIDKELFNKYLEPIWDL